MFNESDLKHLKELNIEQSEAEQQLKRFEKGFPYLELRNAATVGNGIFRLNEEEKKNAIARWNEFLADGGQAIKMVPASGAASRMFKALFNFLESDSNITEPDTEAAKVIDNIENFAFFNDLNEILLSLYGKDIKMLKSEGRHKEIISAIVNPEGLNYGNLPKGLLYFHIYPQGAHTPIEEHLSEAATTERRNDSTAHVHFTVSPEHRESFSRYIDNASKTLEKKYGVKFITSLSEQKKSTDTIAVNPDGTPFRENGKILFRPGGHGALIQNLNDLDATVVFLKNIDNVVPDHKRDATIEYKKILAGHLILLHDRISRYIQVLDNIPDETALLEIKQFVQHELCLNFERLSFKDNDELVKFLRHKLDRPIRVCGMVKNEGEPGGGPYIAYNADGTASPQILESSQLDLSQEENRQMMASATHFNPVDLVCYIRDYNGRKYDLPKYIDPNTGFISEKSLHGRPLRALELPGLWNGAMSDWITIFVEVPIVTFNPVKTVSDLLRPNHQPVNC